jgi:NAD(P)-dependent dehydrogenase (short-subunit alcohol dehydrogenase family)
MLSTCWPVEIRKETGFAGVGQVMILDHGDFASVSAFATEFEKEHDRLDVLIANAGIFGSSRTETKNGWESMYVLISSESLPQAGTNIAAQDTSQPSLHLLAHSSSSSDPGKNR